MLEAIVTREANLVRRAQQLRYRVFAGEWGANLPEAAPGVDLDRYDARCEHLVVRELRHGDVVGTYRILTPGAAREAGGYCNEAKFDLAQLEPLRDRMVEVGRACVDPAWRSGPVMLMLWSALGRYLIESGHDHVFGSASIAMEDSGHEAASVYRMVWQEHLSPEGCRALPRERLPLELLCETRDVAPPPLLRGYLKLGAWICGEPAWDRDFNCADVPILLPLARMNGRYVRHFLANAA